MPILDMDKEYTVVIEQGEDGYLIASVVELPGCHTQAKDMKELMIRVKEAISLYLEVEKDIEPTRFVGIQKVEVSTCTVEFCLADMCEKAHA